MPKVPIQALGGPYDGQRFLLEEPKPFIPDRVADHDEAVWFTQDREPCVQGSGFYMVLDPERMVWVPDPAVPETYGGDPA